MMKPAAPRDYQQEVPAVRRAVDTLEHLATADGPRSLAQLSRALRVGPSSESAILATLAKSNLVARGADGLYRLGPGVYSLASAATGRQPSLARFEEVAPRLVAELGESVLLLRRDAGGLVVVAAREGTQPVRFVPRVGVRIAAGLPGTDGTLTLDGGPGAIVLAVPLDVDQGYLAVAGPRERLQGGHGTQAWPLLREAVGGGPAGQPDQRGDWERGSPIETSALDAFLAQPLVATLSYVSDDGYPASIPLWYDWDGNCFWLLPRPRAEWAEHIRHDPRVSLAVSESVPPLRRVLARGRAEVREESDPRAWQQVQDRVAQRYADVRAARHLANLAASPRQVLRLRPERLIAWRGLLRYPGTTDTQHPAQALA